MSDGVLVDDAIVWWLDTTTGIQWKARGGWEAHVWHVGGENPWRSKLTRDGIAYSRVTSHWKEETAKASAEKRLRKAAT